MGIGLGLAIVQCCVNIYGGEVIVESKEGEGFCFVVCLLILEIVDNGDWFSF